MSALILKDLYIMKKYCRSVLLMVVIFWGASIFADSGNLFWTFFPVIVGSVTPATLLSYDETFRWNQYCDTMPISRAAVVAEKYVLTAATVLLLTAGSVAVQLMASGRTGEAPDDLGLIAALTFTVGLLPPCVMLPAVYKFGMEKGRIVYYFCIGAACAIPFALPSNSLDGGMSTARCSCCRSSRRRCSPCRGRYPRRYTGKRVCENHGRFIDERDNNGA